jgi:putative acetyltransferase
MADSAIRIKAESPLQDDVRMMVQALNAYLRPLTPPQFQFQMTAEQMAGADTTVFVARDNGGRAVGMGSIKRHDGEMAEVKRMFTEPGIRGAGIGRQLLEAIERRARELGIHRLKLETGEAPGFEPAWRLYERGGFVQCGAFLDYPDSGFSRFYEKKID